MKINEVYKLPREVKKKLLIRAKELCYEYDISELDCSKSWSRVKSDLTFEEMLHKLSDGSHFSIHKRNYPYEHYDVGFSTLGLGTDYFLFISLHADKGEQLLSEFGLTKD